MGASTLRIKNVHVHIKKACKVLLWYSVYPTHLSDTLQDVGFGKLVNELFKSPDLNCTRKN